jgi:hypothetical protein
VILRDQLARLPLTDIWPIATRLSPNRSRVFDQERAGSC